MDAPKQLSAGDVPTFPEQLTPNFYEFFSSMSIPASF